MNTYRVTFTGQADTLTRTFTDYDDAAELYLSLYGTLTGDDVYRGFPGEECFPSEGYSAVGHNDGERWELSIERDEDETAGLRAYRMAGFFDRARAAHEEVATRASACWHSSPDGNRDDPTYYYCGYPAGHAGEHGDWKL